MCCAVGSWVRITSTTHVFGKADKQRNQRVVTITHTLSIPPVRLSRENLQVYAANLSANTSMLLVKRLSV